MLSAPQHHSLLGVFTALVVVVALCTSCTISEATECTSDDDCASGEYCSGGGGLFVRDGVCVTSSSDIGIDDAGIDDTDLQCDAPFSQCGDTCVDTSSDPDHCGECHTACSDGQTCADGSCTPECPPQSPDRCDEQCVDLATDDAHCGQCNSACDSGETCSDGNCQCLDELTRCGENCVDTTTDPLHCGGCGLDCQVLLEGVPQDSEIYCDDATCAARCPDGFELCDGRCVDPSTDPDHCGECGHQCLAGCGGDTPGQCDAPIDIDTCAELELHETGDGSADDPFTICTEEHLDLVEDLDDVDVHFALVDDIELSGSISLIGDFRGRFFGQGHAIVHSGNNSSSGLFATINDEAEVHNIRLHNVSVSGGSQTGGLARENQGLIRGVEVTGELEATGDQFVLYHAIGGITGVNEGIIAWSRFGTAEGGDIVIGDGNVGGIAGEQSENGTIEFSSTHAEVEALHSAGGGLVGRMTGGLIAHSTADGLVGGGPAVGGLAGYAQGFSFIHDSAAHADIQTSSRYAGGLVGIVTDDAEIIASTAHGHVQSSSGRVGGFAGIMRDDSQISDSQALSEISASGSRVGGFVGHMRHQSLIEQSTATVDVASSGNYVGGFAGLMSGDSTLYDVIAQGTVSNTSSQTGGLVGRLDDDALAIDSSAHGDVITDADQSGGLVGRLNGSSAIESCSAFGDITNGRDDTGGLVGRMRHQSSIANSISYGDVQGRRRSGGLVGYIDGPTTITDSVAQGDVDGADIDVGGLIGYMDCSNCSVEHSHAYGDVFGTDDRVGGLAGRAGGHLSHCSAHGDVAGVDGVGGLVGQLDGSGLVSQCFATGTISGGDESGGLVGDQRGDIRNSYATGDVTGDEVVGGLVGDQSGDITNTYSTGTVDANDDLGGLIGDNGSDIVSSYWDVDTSGLHSSAGGTALSTGEFSDPTNFSGWNFVTVWRMPTSSELAGMSGDDENIRPRLQWEFE